MSRDDPFTTIRSEGGLLPTDLLARVREAGSGLPGTAPEAYHLVPGEKLNEAITRSWNRLIGAWRAFADERGAAGPGNVATGATRQHWLLPLFQELGFGQLQTATKLTVAGKDYPVSHRWGTVPIHLVGAGVALDARTAGVQGAAAMSPHGLVQELLNRSDEHLWGILSNGRVLQVLRDNASLTRKAYLQFDLEAMFDGEVFADFVVLWLTCHQSRFEGDVPEKCLLELWAREAVEQGTRALDQLRVGVEEAIAAFGEGFLAHRANAELREALEEGRLDKQDYYRQLLRLVYRLLFLLLTESRDLLLDPSVEETARQRYREHYGIDRLRRVADTVRGGPHPDQWRSLQLVFGALGRAGGEPALALPGLGGFLWTDRAIGDLARCELANEHLYRAVRALSMVRDGKVRRRIDYANQGSQELGSVYESLLELHPVLDVRARTFALSTAGGHERKTTGSYYTPDELVEELLDSALDPVLDEAEAADDPEAALLALTVLDPACGSGHFLIAAGRRIANRLARVRAEDGEPSPTQLTAALRDVVGRCLHGIDVNEMAVELCKVSLWMEATEPGKPLSFLDHRIVHGNGLLGTTPRLIEDGIPDDAFKPLTGDDKAVATAWKKRNAQERKGQGAFEFGASAGADLASISAGLDEIDAIDDDDLDAIAAKERRWADLVHGDAMGRAQLAADAWCAAFVAPRVKGASVITTAFVRDAARRPATELDPEAVATVERLADEYRFLHPHLAFPDVFRAPADGKEPDNEAAGWSGGFSVVLGNPPWERVKLQEKEFFAGRRPEIAQAANANKRKRMIEALATGDESDRALFAEFQAAVHHAEGESLQLRGSGRYPLCGRGDVNTYTVFAEGMRDAVGPTGRLGVIVPSGIATDDTTKHFFADLVDRRSLVSLFDFENAAPLFAGVHRSFKFCLLTVTGDDRAVDAAEFVFFAHRRADLADPERRFTLSPEDFALLNPNTRTCPVFRTRRDAEITKAIYRRVPVLVREGDPNGNPWGVKFSTMFHMSNDSHLFRTRDQLEADGWELKGNTFHRGKDRYLPLYEAKMLHHYDHRWANAGEGEPDRALSDEVALPRYWVGGTVVREALGPGAEQYLAGFRNVCRSTDERTVIASLLPSVAVGHSEPVVFSNLRRELTAMLSAFAFDWVLRQKLGGVNLTFGYLGQVAAVAPAVVPASIAAHQLELTYTAWDMEPFAGDLGFDGPPFRWDEERRAVLRAELDALFFHLYGIERDDVNYILETFPIVKRKDEAKFGEYRTKRLILEIYDEMAEAERSGTKYRTRLDPPPADPSLCHPESTRPDWAPKPDPSR